MQGHEAHSTTKHKYKMNILDLFNVTCTATINVEGSVFDGCGDTYQGSHLGYTFHSKWKGVSDRYSCVKSPQGEIVASCDTVRSDGGLWATHENCPEWLMPIGDKLRQYEEQEAAYAAQKTEEEAIIRRDRRELDRVLAAYHGTRLFKHLAKLGKSHLAYLA